LDCYNTLKDQDYSYYTLDCYNVLKDQDYSYYTLDCYYILKDQYSFHKLFLNSYYSFRYHAPYSFRLVIVHCLNITIAPMSRSLATLVIYSSNTLLQGCKTLSMITRFYSRLQGSLYSLTSWFSKVFTHSGYHCSDLVLQGRLLLSLQEQYKTNITARRYRQLLLWSARALRPGVPPPRDSFGRALLRVQSLPVWLFVR